MHEFYKAINYLRDNYPVELVPEELKRRSGYKNMVTTLARRLRWNTGVVVDVVYRKAQSGQEVAYYKYKKPKEIKLYTLYQFQTRLVAIMAKSKKEFIELLLKLKTNGFIWSEPGNTRVLVNIFKKGMCVRASGEGLKWDTDEYYLRAGYTIIKPSQIIWEK